MSFSLNINLSNFVCFKFRINAKFRFISSDRKTYDKIPLENEELGINNNIGAIPPSIEYSSWKIKNLVIKKIFFKNVLKNVLYYLFPKENHNLYNKNI